MDNAVDALDSLLPWINRKLDTGPQGATDYVEVRRALGAFLHFFNGSPAAGHLEIRADPTPSWIKKRTDEVTNDQLDDLEVRLRLLLEQGFGEATLADSSLPGRSLRFAVRTAGRKRPKLDTLHGMEDGRIHRAGYGRAVREHRRAGAYVWQVQGDTIDLIPFAVGFLLREPNMVAVQHCETPGCGAFFVTDLARRGRRQRFCSPECGRWAAAQRAATRKKRRR